MNNVAHGDAKEMRMMMVVTRTKTGKSEEVFVYKHKSKILTKLWELRNGKYGSRISEREREKFIAK